MVRSIVLSLASLALLAPQADAQQDAANLTAFYVIKAKPGMAKQLEAGIRKHNAWHAKVDDRKGSNVTVVVAGDEFGTYRVGYGNLRWADMDRFSPEQGMADGDDVQVNIMPFVESVISRILLRRDDLGRASASDPPATLSWVTYNYIRPGKAAEYAAYLARLKEAYDKANSPYRYFIQQVINGAGTPAYITVRPAEKWADFATPANTRQALVAAYGELEADRLLNVVDEVVLRSASFVAARRADLSYTPR